MNLDEVMVDGWSLQHILDFGGVIMEDVTGNEKKYVIFMDTGILRVLDLPSDVEVGDING